MIHFKPWLQVGSEMDPPKLFMVTGDMLPTACAALQTALDTTGVINNELPIDLDSNIMQCEQCNVPTQDDHPTQEQCIQCHEKFWQQLKRQKVQQDSILAVGPLAVQHLTERDREQPRKQSRAAKQSRKQLRADKERTRRDFMDLCKRTGAVIFYRMQPQDKAEICRLTQRCGCISLH